MRKLIHTMEGLAEFVEGQEADIFKGVAKGDRKDVETLKTGLEKALELAGHIE
ncbi:hypothetical protein P692DRAFT_201788318, partial [Suillus brevipes Sb2]